MLLKDFLMENPVSYFSIITDPKKEPLWSGLYSSYLDMAESKKFGLYPVVAWDISSSMIKIYVKKEF